MIHRESTPKVLISVTSVQNRHSLPLENFVPTGKPHHRVRSTDNIKKHSNSFYAQERPIFIGGVPLVMNVTLPLLTSSYEIKPNGVPVRVNTGHNFDEGEEDVLLKGETYIGSKRNCVGVALTIGKRNYMEDVAIVKGGAFGETDYFGIFDGHNGEDAAVIAAQRLDQIMTSDEINGDDVKPKIVEAFQKLQNEVIMETESGTTASLVFVRKNDIVVVNIGDSMVFILKNGILSRVGKDHKPNQQDEKDRILKDGGTIDDVNGTLRINRVIANYRSIGDKAVHPPLSCIPDVFIVPFRRVSNILIASDGIA
ncbi:protein phosphatase 2C, putative, partial [Entamoeba invadens IP1]